MYTVVSVYSGNHRSPAFALPWLVFQAFFAGVCFIAAFLVAVLVKPNVHKLFAIVPIVMDAVGIYFWIQVRVHALSREYVGLFFSSQCGRQKDSQQIGRF